MRRPKKNLSDSHELTQRFVNSLFHVIHLVDSRRIREASAPTIRLAEAFRDLASYGELRGIESEMNDIIDGMRGNNKRSAVQ